MIVRLAAAALAVSVVTAFAAEAGERGRGCLPASAVEGVLREGRAMRLATIARGLGGEVLRAELCEERGGLVYRITLIDGRGSVRRVVLDARDGRVVYDGRRP